MAVQIVIDIAGVKNVIGDILASAQFSDKQENLIWAFKELEKFNGNQLYDYPQLPEDKSQ